MGSVHHNCNAAHYPFCYHSLITVFSFLQPVNHQCRAMPALQAQEHRPSHNKRKLSSPRRRESTKRNSTCAVCKSTCAGCNSTCAGRKSTRAARKSTCAARKSTCAARKSHALTVGPLIGVSGSYYCFENGIELNLMRLPWE